MHTITIGSQQVSVIGAGCMRIAGLSETETDAFVSTALDNGINFFDEADIYGGGKSEEVLGRWIAKHPEKRENMFIQSKCAIHDGMYDFSKEHILKSVDGILSRLHTDYLDSLLLHRPDILMEPSEVAEAFDTLEKAGKVRHFGVSNENPAQMSYLQSGLTQKLWCNQVQLSCAHTVLIDAGLNVDMHNDAGIDRDGGMLYWCAQHHMAIQAWSPLQMGYFEGVFLNAEKYAALNQKLQEIGERYNVGKDTIAYAWILRLPFDLQVVLGTSKPARLINGAKAADIRLTRTEWYDIYKAAGNMLP